MAGIQALINQTAGGAQGNPNYVYYKLAALGGVFHSVTLGDNDVNCGGTIACYGATQSTATRGTGPRGAVSSNVSYNGALSTSATSLVPAYKAGSGWNFATGLGSVDAANLVTNWHLAK